MNWFEEMNRQPAPLPGSNEDSKAWSDFCAQNESVQTVETEALPDQPHASHENQAAGEWLLSPLGVSIGGLPSFRRWMLLGLVLTVMFGAACITMSGMSDVDDSLAGIIWTTQFALIYTSAVAVMHFKYRYILLAAMLLVITVIGIGGFWAMAFN